MNDRTPNRNAPARLEHRLVMHGDTRLCVQACGRGPLVVLLPSLGRDADDFVPVATALAGAGLRALLASPRGMGGSQGRLDGISLHDFAADVAAAIRAEGGGPALVAGHAFGNWVARVAAVDHPELVRGVAVLAAAHPGIPADLRAGIDVCMDPARPASERLAALARVFFAAGHDASVWLEGWHPAVARAQRAAAAATPDGWWGAGQVPVLDVQAEFDVFAPPSGSHLLAEALGRDRVRVARIRDAGHALVPEQPQALAAVLAEFALSLFSGRP